MNQVYVCGTYFHIYISILRAIYTEDKNSKNLIILNDHTPGIERLLQSLKNSGFFEYAVEVPFVAIAVTLNKERGLLGKFFNRRENIIKFVESNSDITEYSSFIKDSEINLFYNLGLSSFYFLVRYNKNFIRMLEDGGRNYLTRVNNLKAFKRKYILNTIMGDGLDAEVKEILVQYPERLNKRVRFKGKTLELKKMQDNLTQHDSNRILDIFMDGRNINLQGDRKLLLITQPLSEDRFMNEAEKIKLYNDILEKYHHDYNIFIKPHPRETTDYHEKIKYKFTEIPRSFPLEMFDLLKNVNFEIGITLFSGGLKNVSCIKEKIVIGYGKFT